MNKCFLIGRTTRDSELTETASGVKICRFTIAVNRNYTTDGERKTDFFNCVAWRGLAESVARYVHKGDRIAITGSIETRTYEDSDGKKAVVEIIAQDVEFLTERNRRPDGGGNADGTDSQTGGGNRKGKPHLQAFDDDSDIPF